MTRIANALERIATVQEEHQYCMSKFFNNETKFPVDVSGEMRSV